MRNVMVPKPMHDSASGTDGDFEFYIFACTMCHFSNHLNRQGKF